MYFSYIMQYFLGFDSNATDEMLLIEMSIFSLKCTQNKPTFTIFIQLGLLIEVLKMNTSAFKCICSLVSFCLIFVVRLLLYLIFPLTVGCLLQRSRFVNSPVFLVIWVQHLPIYFHFRIQHTKSQNTYATMAHSLVDNHEIQQRKFNINF